MTTMETIGKHKEFESAAKALHHDWTPEKVHHLIDVVDKFVASSLAQRAASQDTVPTTVANQAINDALRLVSKDSERDAALDALLNHVVDDFREMNPSNYTHDEACDLNNWGIEAVGLAQAVQAAMAAQQSDKR